MARFGNLIKLGGGHDMVSDFRPLLSNTELILQVLITVISLN
jgi:hypothetical protein